VLVCGESVCGGRVLHWLLSTNMACAWQVVFVDSAHCGAGPPCTHPASSCPALLQVRHEAHCKQGKLRRQWWLHGMCGGRALHRLLLEITRSWQVVVFNSNWCGAGPLCSELPASAGHSAGVQRFGLRAVTQWH
jgi:hypothetical protein